MRLCKMLLVLLAAALTVGALTVGAWAEQYVNNSGVAASGVTDSKVKWTVYNDYTLYLEPDANGVRELIFGDDPWNDDLIWLPDGGVMVKQRVREVIRHIVIGSRVNKIGEKMFRDYAKLEDVVMYDMYSIGDYAFDNCASLTTVDVRSSVDAFGEYAFYRCNSLKTFTVTGTVRTVGVSCFLNDVSLAAFNAAVTEKINNSAFQGCGSLAEIKPIRGTLGTNAFKNTALSQENVYVVSGHTGELATGSFPSGTYLRYTGTQVEFKTKYSNGTGIKPIYQRIGDNVTWTLEDGVLNITGSGSTIDLLDWTEQPWVNYPGDVNPAQQQTAITKVTVDKNVEIGEHMLEGLEDRTIRRCSVTVTSGTGGGQHLPGETVTLYADPAGEYRRFSGWTGLDGVIFISGSASATEVSFEMPSRDVKAEAHYIYPQSFVITAQANPKECGRVTAVGSYEKDAELLLSAYANDGYQFVSWTEDGNVVSDIPYYSFIVKSDRTLTANFERSSYWLDVLDGTGGGEYAPGTAVTVRADVASAGTHFKEWELTPPINLEFIEGGLNSETIEFYMPKTDFHLEAVYESSPEHTLTVNRGSGGGVRSEGAIIFITADPAPAGQPFREWTWTGAGDLTFENNTNKFDDKAYIRMPDRDVTLTAFYGDDIGEFVRLNSLVLSGKIGLNFFMYLPGLSETEKESAYMTFDITGKGGCTERADLDSGFMNATGDYYGFTCYVNSIQIADKITPTFHFVKDGEEKTITGYAYSIEDYIKDFSENESGFDDTTVTLVRALADYGYYAQHYLQQLHGWKFGESGYAEMKTRFTDYYLIGTDNGLQWKLESFEFGRDWDFNPYITDVRCSLTLDSDTALNAYFYLAEDCTDGYEVEIYKKVYYSDEWVWEVYEGFYIVEEAGGRIKVTIPGLSAQRLGETYRIEVDSNKNYADMTFSALSYLHELTAAHDNSDDAATYAAAALYYYYEAANNWIAAHPEP